MVDEPSASAATRKVPSCTLAEHLDALRPVLADLCGARVSLRLPPSTLETRLTLDQVTFRHALLEFILAAKRMFPDDPHIEVEIAVPGLHAESGDGIDVGFSHSDTRVGVRIEASPRRPALHGRHEMIVDDDVTRTLESLVRDLGGALAVAGSTAGSPRLVASVPVDTGDGTEKRNLRRAPSLLVISTDASLCEMLRERARFEVRACSTMAGALPYLASRGLPELFVVDGRPCAPKYQWIVDLIRVGTSPSAVVEIVEVVDPAARATKPEFVLQLPSRDLAPDTLETALWRAYQERACRDGRIH